MPRTRRSYPPSLKARVAVEAIRGLKTAAQIAQEFAVHPNLVAGWKRQALDQLPEIFAAPAARPGRRRRDRPPLPGDWTAQSRARLSQKKSWFRRAGISADGSTPRIPC